MDICVQTNLGIYVYCAKMKDECYKIKLDFILYIAYEIAKTEKLQKEI